MNKFWLAALSLALVVGVGLSATAKEPKTPKAPKKSLAEVRLEKLDANSDGQLTLDEYCTKDGKPLEGKPKETAEKNFKRFDTDGSGQLSLEELKLAGKKPKTPK